MHLIQRKKVTIAFHLFLVMATAIGCSQHQGALPSGDPPNFEAWEHENTQARVQSQANFTPVATPNMTGNPQSNDELEIIELTNAERQLNGLGPLKVNENLMNQARIKAQDMISNSYFSHDSPTLGSPFDQIRSAQISFESAGENIAGNFTAVAAFQAWLNSSGHRANILNKDFDQIGVGVVAGGPYGKMFVQMFIR